MDRDKQKILIVDDSNYQRSKLKQLLKSEGYKVCEAVDGVDGVCMFRKESPNLVVMDINMPYLEGIEALEIMLKLDRNAVIIMFSTLDDEKTVKRAIKAGARDYVVKPMNEKNMLETIFRHLGD